ncbi:MAG: CerR family C-terminal domain-containing protein [Planctomycetales bacterium]
MLAELATTEDTRERLIHAAGEIFAEKGFRSTTVREICDRANANLAAVNYHFGDKFQLYLAAVEQAHCCPVQFQNVEWPAHFTVREKLHAFVETMLANHLDAQRPEWHNKLMLRELSDPTAACAQLVDAHIRPSANILWKILEELRPEEMTEEEGWLVGFSIVGQCLFYKINKPIAALLMGRDKFDQVTIQQLADHITRFSLAALGAAPHLGRPTQESRS